MIRSAVALLALVLGGAQALAYDNKYNITQAEQLACSSDAMMLCSTAQDSDELITCMRQNRPSLSRICLVTFEAGLKRRHMPL